MSATGKREGGPVGEKKSEGGYASPSPSYIQVEPPPPLSPVSLCEFTVSLCKNPFHMTCLVLCYGQHAQPQPLARVAQTWSANGTKDAQFVACRGRETRCHGRARRVGHGRAVVLCGAGDVTHFPHTIATHLHLLTQLTCNSAAALSRHRTTATSPVGS